MSERSDGSTSGGGSRPARSTPPPLPGRLPALRKPAPAAAAAEPEEESGLLAAPPTAPARAQEQARKKRKKRERLALDPDRDPSLWPFAWAVALVLVPLAAFFQQYTLRLGTMTLENAPDEIRQSEAARPPDVSELVIQSKFLVKQLHHEGMLGDDEEHEDVEWDEDWGAQSIADLEPAAVSRTERVRLAIVAGEVQGAEAALERLTVLEKEVTPGGDLAGDVAWLKKLYAEGPEALDEAVRRSLVDRHGWFGELAISFRQPDYDPVRWNALTGFGQVIGLIIALVAGWIGSFLLGILMLVVLGIVAATQGLTLRFEPPEPGGSVYLEMFNVFVGGFALVLALFLFLFGLHAEGTAGALVLLEVATWGLFIAVLYPMVVARVPWKRALHDLGLHSGRGFFREVGCGIIGHLAGLPIIWFIAIIMWVVELLTGDAEAQAQGLEGYPIFQSPAGDTWMYVWIGAASAVIWAPLLEEIVFRGALYRHLRSRLRVPLAALISAGVFAMVHPYTTSGIVQVAFSGLVFAALREWRGSLIAPITAHALHNGTIMAVQIGVLMAIE